MQGWVLQIMTVAVAAPCGGGHPGVPAAARDAFDRAAMRAASSVDTAVPSRRCQRHAVGRAVARRALSRPMARPDGITLQRLEIAAVQLPPRRYL